MIVNQIILLSCIINHIILLSCIINHFVALYISYCCPVQLNILLSCIIVIATLTKMNKCNGEGVQILACCSCAVTICAAHSTAQMQIAHMLHMYHLHVWTYLLHVCGYDLDIACVQHIVVRVCLSYCPPSCIRIRIIVMHTTLSIYTVYL